MLASDDYRAFSFICLRLLPVVQNDDGSGDLKIKNVQIWHEGRYTCTAQTVVDSDTAYADLKVVGQSSHLLPRSQRLSLFLYHI